jgi:hypothetical protein
MAAVIMNRIFSLTVCAFVGIGLGSVTGCAADSSSEDTDQSEEDLAAQCGPAFSEIFLYAPYSGEQAITKQLQDAKLSPCTQVYVTAALDVDDKTQFHAGIKQQLDRIHANGPKNFHALAIFHWQSWRKWIAASPGTRDWKSAGREFRKRMDDAGFDVHNGSSDTWFVDELASPLLTANAQTSTKEYRDEVLAAVSGLFDGGKLPNKKGGVAHIGTGEPTNRNVQTARKRLVEDLLADEEFFIGMDKYTRWFAEEVYGNPALACEPGTSAAARVTSVNGYTQHYERLADSQGAAPAARSYMHKAHVALVQGSWLHDDPWGNTMVDEAAMERFLSLEVYATRTFDARDPNAGHRFGIAIVPPRAVDAASENILTPLYEKANPGAPLPSNAAQRAATLESFAADQFENVLMDHLGRAIRAAYVTPQTSPAAAACLTSGTTTGCECDVKGAKLDTLWASTFGAW